MAESFPLRVNAARTWFQNEIENSVFQSMVFVPSADGTSHSAREFTHWADCVNEANVLLQTVLSLAAN